MRRGAPSRRVRAAPSSSIIPPFLHLSSRHPPITTIPSPPVPAVTSGLVLTRFNLPHHGSSSRRGAPMRFSWLAPLVPDSQVLDSQVLPTFAGRFGLGSTGGPTAPGARGMGPKVVRPRDVPRPVAEPVRGSEGGASLHLRQGGETLSGSGSGRMARCYQCCCCSPVPVLTVIQYQSANLDNLDSRGKKKFPLICPRDCWFTSAGRRSRSCDIIDVTSDSC